MVATDRLSAFDVVLPTSIPDKGAVLNQVSAFWFDKTSHIVPNHFISLATEKAETLNIPHEVARRAMVVLKAERIDVECVVRGYITGSAWSEYRKEGTVGGQPMPQGMQEGDKFPEPLFTPTTKAEVGHDEAMTIGEVEDMVGVETAAALAETTKSVYVFAHDLALTKGIIIADTKLEFGTIDGNLTLIDELLTPDSSRFWDQIGYAPGKSQPNFDKQFVRDWLNEQGWDHEPPAPELPDDVVNRTRQRYEEALQKLTGAKLA
jgi:phosphoribosylaminoimidazole-succinocarboxamide synthase